MTRHNIASKAGPSDVHYRRGARAAHSLGQFFQRVARHHVGNLITGLALSLAVAGCGLPQSMATPPPSLTPTALSTPLPTATATAVATATATATLTPTATMTPSPTATATPTVTPDPLHAQVILDGSQVTQGHTAILRVKTNRSVSLRGTIAEERQLIFTSSDGLDHIALIGIHALAELGAEPVRIVIDADDGQQLILDTELYVVAGTYSAEQLTFTPAIAKLLDPQIADPENERMAEVFASSTGGARWQGLFDWPLKGAITSEFGTRRLYQNTVNGYHAGLDIDGEEGDIIRATASGIVVMVEQLQVRGNAVVIDHGAGVMSSYFHMSEIDVHVGQQVAKGEVLGKVGATGLVTGSHLHWEIHVGGVAVNPQDWLSTDFLASESGE